jgi:steroid delta-isomerase-like uncharacterized protein
MPAEENKALIQRAYNELWNERNVDVVDELVTEDFRNHAAPPDRQRGRQSLKDVVRMFESAFPDFRYEVEDVITEGEKVAVRDHFRGTHQGDFMGIPATGNRVTMEAIHIYRFSEGKLAEHWVARDDLGMMRQLGVVPAPGQSDESNST